MSVQNPKRRRRFKVPRGFMGLKPTSLGDARAERATPVHLAIAVLLTLALYGLIGTFVLRNVHAPPAPRVLVTSSVQLQRKVEVAQPLPPPPPPPPQRQARRTPAPAAPAAAAKVVARAEAQPLDFSGFDIVAGESTHYVGGFTAPNGTGQNAVTDPNATTKGVVGGHASLARVAGPARKDWACAWPDEAQDSELHDLRVSVRVHLDMDGAPQSVEVLGSPAAGFAAAARACALAEEYRPALDDEGHRVAAVTPMFVVHFVR